jgi:hypothetical protein
MKPRILLDSGTYSAFHQRREQIELKAYISFVKRNSHLIEHPVNLDVIHDGRDPDETKAACEKSYSNFQIMKNAGLKPLPVVHQTDGSGWLEKYLEEAEPYIALAPRKNGGKRAIKWLLRCFETIRQASYPVKVHGLAVTSSILMTEFPWTSVDSTTWIRQAACGIVFVPVYEHNDCPEYQHRPHRYFVTDRTQAKGNHIDRLSDLKLDGLRLYLQKECGLSVFEIRYDHRARWRAFIRYFKGLEATSNTRLYFVNGPDTRMRDILIDCGAGNHLISYYALRGQPDDSLERYVNGVSKPSKPRKVAPDWSSDAYIRHRKLAAFRRLERNNASESP